MSVHIAQESIFIGLDNLPVNSVLNEDYDSYFGFTNEEYIQSAVNSFVTIVIAELKFKIIRLQKSLFDYKILG